MRKLNRLISFGLLAGIIGPQPHTLPSQRGENLAPFVPTPMPVVHKMLELAGVTKDDVVHDLGCGDGRIVVAAAEQYGARGVGVEYDPELVVKANALAREQGVEKLVTILEHDAMTVDISSATVVTLYLLSESNRMLKPRLENLLPPGTRVVAHRFLVPGWKPIQTVPVNEPGAQGHHIYLYRTPGGDALSGTWRWMDQHEGQERRVTLRLREDGQRIAGVCERPSGGAEIPVKAVKRTGDSVTVELLGDRDKNLPGLTLVGTLSGDRIVGKITQVGEPPVRDWVAKREAVNIDGLWAWTNEGEDVTLQLTRTPDRIQGDMIHGSTQATVSNASTTGSRLEFEARTGAGTDRRVLRYRGWIEGDTIVGTVHASGPNTRPSPWQARRARPGDVAGPD